MAKLHCSHKLFGNKRRVMVLPSGNAVHRSDGTNCTDLAFRIGDTLANRDEVLRFSTGPTDTPEKELLTKLFVSKNEISDRFTPR